MHHQSCKQSHKFLVMICSQCGNQRDASDILEALQSLLDAVNLGAVTQGDCNQAQRALDEYKAA